MGLGGQGSGPTSLGSGTHPGHGRQLRTMQPFICNPCPKAGERALSALQLLQTVNSSVGRGWRCRGQRGEAQGGGSVWQ